MNNWELIILNIKESLLSLKKSNYKYILCVCLSHHIVRLHGPTVSNSQTLRRCRESSTALIYTASPVDHSPPSYPCNMKIYAAKKIVFSNNTFNIQLFGKANCYPGQYAQTNISQSSPFLQHCWLAQPTWLEVAQTSYKTREDLDTQNSIFIGNRSCRTSYKHVYGLYMLVNTWVQC